MGGYSFACAVLRGKKRSFLAICVLAIPPASMVVAACIACVGTDKVEHLPAFSGLIAFALVALLFLVLQELLIEANEKGGGELWQISVWLYIGLFFSLCLDILL